MIPLRRRIAGLAAAASSAVLLFAAGEPLGFGPLAWVALLPLLVVVARESRWRWAWLYGLAFGVVYFGVHLSWIFLFGWMAWTSLTFVLALYVSAATLVAGVVNRVAFWPLFAAGAWTGMELVRDRWPVGGYSWGSVGTTQGSVPGVRWLAGVVGVYGLSFLVVFATALVAAYIVRAAWEWRAAAVVGVVLAIFAGVDVVRYSSPDPVRPVSMAVVQGNVPRPPQPDQRDRVVAAHIELTRELVRPGSVDLVVWPEDAIGIGVSPGAISEVGSLAAELETPFLVGHSVPDVRTRSFGNLVRHITAEGEIAGTYQKRHPVPFGEYVPFAFLRSFVGTLESEIPFDLQPGTEAAVFDVEGVKVATPICFESVFPRDFLDFARRGTELFVLSTNNASFERSYASQQHLAHTRMRALETRQWVVQAALSGISAVLGPDGSISQTTDLFTAEAFIADVGARPAHSLYASTGDLFPSLWGGATLIGLVAVALSRRRRDEVALPDSVPAVQRRQPA